MHTHSLSDFEVRVTLYGLRRTLEILNGFCRSDIAWKDAKYGQIWEYLRDEFELTQRFASLDFKLKFVEV